MLERRIDEEAMHRVVHVYYITALLLRFGSEVAGVWCKAQRCESTASEDF